MVRKSSRLVVGQRSVRVIGKCSRLIVGQRHHDSALQSDCPTRLQVNKISALQSCELSSVKRDEMVVLNEIDRKSTRLNSSHANISYAVFCLKKKKQQKDNN